MLNLIKKGNLTMINPPTLFKAQNQDSHEEVFFNTFQEAYEWMLIHKNWILKKRKAISWSFPLEQTITKECWVKV